MTTVVLAPGQTTADSSPIVVNSGQTVVITIYSDSGAAIPTGVDLFLRKLTAAGNYQQVATLDYGKIVFTESLTVLAINYAGTYLVHRQDISAYGVNVGVSTD